MTKTLTEQWREGTLLTGCYYVLSTEDDTPVACDIDVVSDFMIRDVVEPVPGYEEYNKLRKLPLKCFQLEEDNSALMVINKDMCKEIERLQEQLNEANEAIDEAYWDCFNEGFEPDLAKEYLKKWGLK